MRKVQSQFRILSVGFALSSVIACSAAPDGASSAPSSAHPAGKPDSLGTQVEGERFTSLDVSADKVSGVFVRGDESLAFAVDRTRGALALRLATAAGDVLYSQVQGPTGIEMHVGSSYQSLLPPTRRASPFGGPTSSPVGFVSTGNLKDALFGLKSGPMALLPYLSAALGRVGLTGHQAPIVLPLHMLAMHLTEELGLGMDPSVKATTNGLIAAKRPLPGIAEGAIPPGPDATGAVPGSSKGVHTEGLPFGGTLPGRNCTVRPPCVPPRSLATQGLFAGCCVQPPPPSPPAPPDYSNTPSCHSGSGREALNSLGGDPCNDNCVGMCGPGCDPWLWVCGDDSVHTACWNHDRAYCAEDWFDPAKLICEATYLAYSTWIFADTEALGLCENDVVTDIATEPWSDLATSHPDYYDYDPNP